MQRRYYVPRRPWKEVEEDIVQVRASYNVNAAPKDYYNKVVVIHFTWDKDHLPDLIPTVMDQSQKLEKTFGELYNYETKRIVLPHDAEAAAYDMLEAEIRKFWEDGDNKLSKNDLFILHYQGHGDYTIRQEFNSQGQKEEYHYSHRLAASYYEVRDGASEPVIQTSILDFTKLREAVIDQAEFQVLMLMDCCHAATAACGPLFGKELLAASEVGHSGEPSAGKAPWDESSFTNNVNNILEHAYDTGNIMPTSQLFARLYGNFWTRKEIGDDVRKLQTAPVHMLLSPGIQIPIILAPLRAVVSRYQPVIDSLAETRLPSVRMDCFVSDGTLDVEVLRRHLRERHGLQGHITVNNVFQTGSCIIELEMSVSTWYMIGHLPDLQFRYVKGPKKLNPPNVEFNILEHPNLLTIRPKNVPGQIDESSKPPPPAKGGDTSKKENEPFT